MEIGGTVAVVTGAAAGAGRAIALRLGAEGAFVVVADVDPGGGEATVEAIAAAGGSAAFVRADMTDDDGVRAMVAAAAARGPLRILVNNAGGGGHVPPHFPDASPAQWGATLELNLRGPMLATQLALEPMRSAGGGAVVNVASTAGLERRAVRLARVRRGEGGADPVHDDARQRWTGCASTASCPTGSRPSG